MSDSSIFDFDAIKARMKEIREQQDAAAAGSIFVFDETTEDIKCDSCMDTGWVISSYQSVGAPNFDECPDCENPHNLPCP